jgi:hypothetical protein
LKLKSLHKSGFEDEISRMAVSKLRLWRKTAKEAFKNFNITVLLQVLTGLKSLVVT